MYVNTPCAAESVAQSARDGWVKKYARRRNIPLAGEIGFCTCNPASSSDQAGSSAAAHATQKQRLPAG
jgi:hypothetical protein